MSDNDDTKNTSSDDKDTVSNPSRRRFVKNTGMVIGGVAGGSLLGGLFTNQFQKETLTEKSTEDKNDVAFTEARMFFTRYADFVVLEQATERIYPEDDNGPGAIELGVPYFIDKQLAGPWGMNGKDYRQGPFIPSAPTLEQTRQTRGELFIKGMRTMNQLSQKRFDTSFDKADKEQQMEVLNDFAEGNVDMKGVASSAFFDLLRATTLEGVYSDPLYGGNKNMEGWKMKEFPGSIPSYTDVVEKDEFVKMEPVSLTNYQQKS